MNSAKIRFLKNYGYSYTMYSVISYRHGGKYHAKTEMEPEYHLHIRTAAGKSGAHLPLRHDYRCCRPWATERLRRLVGIWPSVPKQKRYISFASVYIPITLLFFGKAYRTLLLGQALTSCGTIPAPRMPPAADCWWMISAMSWRKKILLYLCGRFSSPDG